MAGAPAREGWAFGAGLEPGLGGESDATAYGGGASLRVLYVFNRWFGLGVESNVWVPDLTVGNYRTSVMTAAVSCFPFGGRSFCGSAWGWEITNAATTPMADPA